MEFEQVSSNITSKWFLDVDEEWIYNASIPFGILFGMGVICSLIFQSMETPLKVRFYYSLGFVLSLNFAIFWAFPIAFQGGFFKAHLVHYLRPIYKVIDESKALRWFAKKFIYRDARHSDYFATQILFLISFTLNTTMIFYWQLTYHYLPWWLILVYNMNWVGTGGRMMGSAYTFAHREGHNTMIYSKGIRNTLGNVFENWIGLLYGNVPYNFSTTHNSLHHRLNAAVGDTLYCWDLERCSWPDFTFYASRGLFHMSGFAALRQFLSSNRHIDRNMYATKLMRGLFVYWVVLPIVVLYVFQSVTFYFFIILQPLLCMTFFINMINWGFHAFMDSDRSPTVESVCLLGSDDDYFGEDDHMAHHLYPGVFHRDLPAHQESQHQKWAKAKATVFQGPDAASFGLLILLKAWKQLAPRYVDYSQSMTIPEIEKMLEERSKRVEMHVTDLLPAMDHDVHKPLVDKDAHYINSAMYNRLLKKLQEIQATIAVQVDGSLPPIKKLKLD